MKKIALVLLCVVIMASCVSCGSEGLADISDRTYELGSAALETLYDFIDGRISGDEAIEKIERVSALLDNLNLEYGSSDKTIELRISLSKNYVREKMIGTGTMSAVKECADELAKMLGK